MSASLHKAFSSIEDPRIDGHKRHKLIDIIILIAINLLKNEPFKMSMKKKRFQAALNDEFREQVIFSKPSKLLSWLLAMLKSRGQKIKRSESLIFQAELNGKYLQTEVKELSISVLCFLNNLKFQFHLTLLISL